MQLDIDFLYNIVIRLPRKVAFLERFHSDKRCVQIQIVFKMKFQVSITCLTFLMYRISSEILKNGIQVQTYDQTLIYTFDYLYNANQ